MPEVKKEVTVVRVVLMILVVIVLAVAVYFTWFYSYTCSDLECYQAHQKKCSRTKYINDDIGTTWKYHIQGKQDNKCDIEVTVLQIKTGDLSKQNLEGLSMNCYLPLQSLVSPEGDLVRCHGVLKEELQSTIINKLHAYIIENIGEISEELNQTI